MALKSSNQAFASARAVSELVKGQYVAQRYLIIHEIGTGGMANVYAAHDVYLNRPVAIKAMLPSLLQYPLASQRFVNEAQALARLKSNYVVRILDAGTEGDLPYMVLEYLAGIDLGDFVRQKGPFSVRSVARIMLQLCSALAEAHRLGIVHRDLKPENLFLTRSPNGRLIIKLIDFGISKQLSSSPRSLTNPHESVGSPDYMAPEQMREGGAVDTRTDIWALGAAMYFLVTGQPPFRASSIPCVCAKVLDKDPVRPRYLQPTLPLAFEQIILRCLDKAPEKRFSSVQALAKELQPFADDAAARLGTSARTEHDLSLAAGERQTGAPNARRPHRPAENDNARRPHRPAENSSAYQVPPSAFAVAAPRNTGWVAKTGLGMALTAAAYALATLGPMSTSADAARRLSSLESSLVDSVAYFYHSQSVDPGMAVPPPEASLPLTRQSPDIPFRFGVKASLPRVCGHSVCEGAVREVSRPNRAPILSASTGQD